MGEDPCGRPGHDVYDGPSRETLTHVGGVSFICNLVGLREHLPWGAVEAESKMLPRSPQVLTFVWSPLLSVGGL